MRVNLIDLEAQFDKATIAEAMDLVRETNEFDVTEPEPGYYHCISKQPDYHVEMTMRSDGLVQAQCHCTVFKRAKVCRHALAALFLLREHLFRERRKRKKNQPDKGMLEEVLKKIPITDLRQFLTGYARSHTGFRAEIMANFLHLIRKPDYHVVLMDLTPIDKYGQIKLNRNQVKHVRNILSTLLKQAQELLKNKAPGEAFQILEATLPYLYRLMSKVPQFSDQLVTELKFGLKLFDALCQQSMAPRLQEAVLTFTLDISAKDNHIAVKGMKPMLLSIEPFLLLEKSRQTAFHLASSKLQTDPNPLPWAMIVARWSRMWNLKRSGKETNAILHQLTPDLIHEAARASHHEDVLHLVRQLNDEAFDMATMYGLWKTGLKSARQLHEPLLQSTLGFKLCIHFFDQEAWEMTYQTDPPTALKALQLVAEYQAPGTNTSADSFLLEGYIRTNQTTPLFERLKAIGDIHLWMQYDHAMATTRTNELVQVYADHIRDIRDAYGGVIARQKLSDIFGHLKSINLYTQVTELVKRNEQKHVTTTDTSSALKGFVFDLDGVIVDTAVHHFESWRKILRQLGTEISEEDDAHTRGASRMESLDYLLNKYGIVLTQEEKEMWAARKNELYLEAIQEITPRDLLPGALAFLIDSRKAGLKLALGSASKNARGVLDKLGISDRFDAILDGNDAQASKPDPEIFTKACKALDLNPSSVVVFEDAAKGVQAAVAAGCKVVGLGDADTLAQADLVVSGLDVIQPSYIIEKLS